MRAVVHWFRFATLAGGLCVLPSGPAVPFPVFDLPGANRPAMVVASTATPAPGVRNVNFVEAIAPITLSNLRYDLREATATPAIATTAIAAPVLATRMEAVAAGLGHGRPLPPGTAAPAAESPAAPDRNSMLVLMLAGLGVAALAAARAPADANTATTVQNEPVRNP